MNSEPITPELLAKIKNIIDIADFCMHAYMWTNQISPESCDANNKAFNHETVAWRDGNDIFEASFVFRQNMRGTYAKGIYFRNGEKTTLTAVKNSYKRLTASDYQKTAIVEDDDIFL